ncbi:YdgA family protein [Eleftheria terrae]|uniref:YdgA family protein n=1 Tax=Eleftheria terrae TaxID=1597781 RepID=UPI00263B1831|nr:YdgA family protein [Eleftheria terrae]WKB50657.1 YdgA family protein [Eleftheria terrae]
MKKPLAVGLGVVALAAAAYVGSAAYVGGRVQTELLAQQTKLSEQLPFIKVTDHKYEKGLFSATRTVTVQIGCDAGTPAEGEEAPPKPVLITLRDHISHGPLAGGQFGAALIESELELPPEVRKGLTQLFGDKKPFTVRTLVGFGGGYSSEFSSPDIQFKGPQGEQLAWKGVKANISSDAGGTYLKYDVSAPGLEVNDPAKGAKMVVTNISWRGESRPVNGSMWLRTGKDEGEIASIEFAAPPLAQQAAEGAGEPFKFTFDKLKFASDTSVEKDLLNSKVTMTGAGTIAGTKLDKLEMQASLKRLHAPTYQRIMSSLMKAAGTACAKPEEQPNPDEMLAGMQNELLALLPYNPEYALDKLAVEYAGKRGELSYSVGVEGVTEADLKTPAMMLLMGKGVVKADVKLPVTWIEQIAAKAPTQTAAMEPGMVGMMLDQFAQQGFIVRQGEHVAASMRLEKGAVLLNGKPIPVPGLGGGLPDLGEAEEDAEHGDHAEGAAAGQ